MHPAVEDALVFGVPDERFGQRVVGVASLSPGPAVARPDEILADASVRDWRATSCRGSCGSSSGCPRTPNGKPNYPAARNLFLAGMCEQSS